MTNFLLFLIFLALPGGAAILSALVGMAAFAVLAVGVVILLVVVAASLIANPDALVVIGSVALIVLGLTLATAGVQKSKNLVEAKFGKRAWELTVQRAASAMAVALVIGVTIAAYAQGGLRGAVIAMAGWGILGAFGGGMALIARVGRTRPKQTLKFANRALGALLLVIVAMIVAMIVIGEQLDDRFARDLTSWLALCVVMSLFLCIIAFRARTIAMEAAELAVTQSQAHK